MLAKRLVLLLLFAILASCKIQISVPGNGAVNTASGAYECDTGKLCEIDVVDIFFDETFIGIPDQGYLFDTWAKGDKWLCGGKTTECRLFTSFFEQHTALMAILESDSVWVLAPRFLRDLSGNWSVVSKEFAEECGDGINLEPAMTIRVNQTGNALQFAGISATLNDGVVTWSQTYDEFPDPGTTVADGRLTVSADGNRMTGRESWTFSEPGFTCAGYDEITADRILQ